MEHEQPRRGDLRRQLYQARPAGQPGLTARTPAVRWYFLLAELRLPFEFYESSSEMVSLPYNLRDTTEVEQMTHEVRVSVPTTTAHSNGRQASFIRTSNATIPSACPRRGTMVYEELLETGKDRCMIGLRTGHPSMRCTMDFRIGTAPYVSDLTYDLRQMAVFGEATYTLFDRLDLTAGLRWYDWEEDKTFKSGGVLSNYIEKRSKMGKTRMRRCPPTASRPGSWSTTT